MDFSAYGTLLFLSWSLTLFLEKAITNQNAKDYLEGNIFSDVRVAMKELLDYIQTSGELEKYWNIVEK